MPKKEPVEAEIVKDLPAVVNPADQLIAQAIDKQASVDVMRELMNVRREFKQDQAKQEYDAAMSRFQSDLPIIRKTKTVSNARGAKLYSYAPIDSIVEQVRPLLTKHGLSYTFNIENTEKFITSVCTITHVGGHSESKRFGVPIGTGTNLMSQPQLYASAQTFANRYALCNSLGIATGDEDADAVKETVEPEPSAHDCVRCAKNKVKTELTPDEMMLSNDVAKLNLCTPCLQAWHENHLKKVTP